MSGKVSKMKSQKQKTPQTTINRSKQRSRMQNLWVGSKTAFLEEEVLELRIEAHTVLVRKTQKGELILRSRNKMFKAKP